jgi:hypothetical protein
MATTGTPFVLAVRAYINKPTKKKRASFIEKYLVNHERIGPEDVQATLVTAEKQRSQRPGNIFRLVFGALYDYDGVLSALCQYLLCSVTRSGLTLLVKRKQIRCHPH